MGKKVESYQSDDGKLFATEREMVMHEIDITLRKEFPALKIGLGAISQNADRLLEILQPLASCPPKNHPAEVAQTTLCTCQRYPTHCANDCPLHGLEDEPVAENRPVRLAHG